MTQRTLREKLENLYYKNHDLGKLARKNNVWKEEIDAILQVFKEYIKAGEHKRKMEWVNSNLWEEKDTNGEKLSFKTGWIAGIEKSRNDLLEGLEKEEIHENK